MTEALPLPPPPLRAAVELWCVAGATGMLRRLGAHGGAIWLVDGRITYAESALACGVTRMLTASGRLSADAFRAAVAAGRADGDLAAALTGPDLLTPVELESVFTAAAYSALHQLLDTAGEARFELGVRHPLGGVLDVDMRTMFDEIDRRRAALDEAWPDDAVDSAPVSPVHHLRSHLVALSALQWEIVVNANRRRTPADIARLLGRDTYATLLAVRRMVRGGLVAPVPARVMSAVPVPAGRRVNGAKPAIRVATAPARARRATPPTAEGALAPRGATRTPRGRTASRPEPERLPTRDPRVLDAHAVEPADRPAESWTENTLVRIRDALRALR